MNVKKLVVVVVLASIVLLLYLGYKMLPSGITGVIPDGDVAKGQDVLITELGDKFSISYETSNFPKYRTDVVFYDEFRKDLLCSYGTRTDYLKPDYVIRINTNELRCYEVNSSVYIYKIKNQKFKGIDFVDLHVKKIERNDELIMVLKKLVQTSEWDVISDVSECLLRSGDQDIRELLNRYAKYKFTDAEIRINRDKLIQKQDMVKFANELLNKYN